MMCTSPIFVFPVGEVPCGRCLGCKVARTKEWGMRIIHEMAEYERNCFITLTYDDDHLPLGGTLNKSDLVLFVKRLRKRVAPLKIKVFGCGEYGETFGRPHYHLIVFGMKMNDENFSKCWDKGLLHFGSLTIKSAQYVAGYIQKKLVGAGAANLYGEKLPPFQIQSKGIGLRWMEKNTDQLVNDLSLTVRGNRQSMPRYYRKKLDDKISDESLEMRSLAMKNELEQFLVDHGMTMKEAKPYLKEFREQKNAELIAKIERYRARGF
ncbi:MAG: replication initiator protein [Arizlama microvirus]|nr:MAG: replication initiator protein [Arizlama microvirus]